jgi:HPt (histidine-containing phosphotransfer) domain-containing protein
MFDKSKALNFFQISEDMYDELLKEFLGQAEEKIGAVESALKNGDTETAAREMHSLKGVAGNMRLDDCYNAAIAVESAVRSNDKASIEHWFLTMHQCVDEIRVSLQKNLGPG